MTNLVKAENQSVTRSLDVCSPELWRRLTDERPGFHQACQALLGDRAELTEALPKLEAAAAPCGNRAVIAELAPLVSLYGVPDKSEGEWKAFWGFYTAALADVPHEALRAGVQDYVRDPKSEFFPKPGPLLALCDKRAAPIRTAISRARRVVNPPAVSDREMAYRLQHYADTREWKPSWGERPKEIAA